MCDIYFTRSCEGPVRQGRLRCVDLALPCPYPTPWPFPLPDGCPAPVKNCQRLYKLSVGMVTVEPQASVSVRGGGGGGRVFGVLRICGSPAFPIGRGTQKGGTPRVSFSIFTSSAGSRANHLRSAAQMQQYSTQQHNKHVPCVQRAAQILPQPHMKAFWNPCQTAHIGSALVRHTPPKTRRTMCFCMAQLKSAAWKRSRARTPHDMAYSTW